jgi:hypothetical protein
VVMMEDVAIVNIHIHCVCLCCRFEDGTLPFLEILAVSHGFDTLQMVAGITVFENFPLFCRCERALRVILFPVQLGWVVMFSFFL